MSIARLQTGDLLQALGFSVVPHPLAGTGQTCDFGNLQVTAVELTNEYLRQTMQFSGVGSCANSIRHIDFQMPLSVGSYEQGVAWVVYGIGTDFKAHRAPDWWRMGLGWQDYLPWNVEAAVRAAKYAARPFCSVKRSWARAVLTHLREIAKAAGPSDQARFGFDGEVLRVHACGDLIAVPAAGHAWDVTASVPMSCVEGFPKRLMQEVVEVSVWNDCLCFDRRGVKLGQGGIEPMVGAGAHL